MGRLDRPAPQKVKINTWTQKGGGQPEGLASETKPAHVVFPVGLRLNFSLIPRSNLSSPLSTNDIVGGIFTYEFNFILELLQIVPLQQVFQSC